MGFWGGGGERAGMQAGHGTPLPLGIGPLKGIKNVGHGSTGFGLQTRRTLARSAFDLHESQRAGEPIWLQPLGALKG